MLQDFERETYPVCGIDIRSDLAWLPLLGGSLWVNYAIWRDEPVSRAYRFTIIVSNIESYRSNFGELNLVSPRSFSSYWRTYCDKGHQIIVRIGKPPTEEK
jgi:hypothetical protein